MKTQQEKLLKLFIALPVMLLIYLLTANAQTSPDEEKRAAIKRLNAEAMGLFLQSTGESLPVAREKFLVVQNFYLETGEKRLAASTLVMAGRISHQLGEYAAALKHLNRAVALWQEVGDQKWEALTLIPLGFVYNALGETEQALTIFHRVQQLGHATANKIVEASALHNIGRAHLERREYKKSLENYRRALSLYQEVGAGQNEMGTLGDIGFAHFKLGERAAALEYLQKALQIARGLGDRVAEAGMLLYTGRVYLSADGEKAKALQSFQQALALFRAGGNKRNEIELTAILQEFWLANNNPRLAVFYGKLSSDNFQKLRSNIQNLDRGVQQTFLKSVKDTYRRLADSLISQKRYAEAQQILNAFKDQQFFDFDQSKPFAPLAVTVRESELTAAFNQKVESAAATIGVLDKFKRDIGKRPLTADENAQLKSLTDQQLAANEDYLAFLKSAEDDFAAPPTEKDKFPDVVDLTRMQTILRASSAATMRNTVAVYQLVGEENFRTIIVTTDDIKSVSVPIKSTALNDKAKQLWALLQSDKYDVRVLSKEIHDIVFKPLEKELPKDTRTIMWSMDGNLRYVPMAALFDGERYLVERFENVVFTRADSERLMRPVTPIWTGTGFGSTKAQTVELLGNKINFAALPGVTEELREIFKTTSAKSGILDGEVLPNEKFNQATMLRALKQKRPLVHIASHFSFRPGDESRSFLLMGDGTAYTLEEMKKQADLFAGVELLTLSACNTAAQQADANGREVDGFAELAQRLGAGAVMATLWSVADNSTPWLMRDFYANRQDKNGMTKSEALRTAQLSLLKGTARTKPLPELQKGKTSVRVVVTPDGKRDDGETRAEMVFLAEKNAPIYNKNGKSQFAHPYYWSPFVLIGNWR